MQAAWFRRRKIRLLVGLLLLPALAARVLVPQGFMPGTGADDAPTMQMCHGAGPLPTATQPVPGGDSPAPGQGQHHEAPCVFAASGSAAPPPAATVALDTPQAHDTATPVTGRVFAQKALHRAQAARAPPSTLLLA